VKCPLLTYIKDIPLYMSDDPHSSQAIAAIESARVSNMSSATVYTTANPTDNRHLDILTATSEVEGDHPPSSLPLEGTPRSEDNPNPTTTKHQWNGDPMDWESWPTGRPGQFVSSAAIQRTVEVFQSFEQKRDELSRTEEKVFHVAEFSSTGRGEFDVYRCWSE
jgi:hypothetical protein